MSYSDMNGLELFGDPFSRPQAYNQPTSRNSYSKATQPRATTTQHKTPVQQPAKLNSTETQPEPAKTQLQQLPTNSATQSKSPVLQQNSGNPISESNPVTSTKELTPADVKAKLQQPQPSTNSTKTQAQTPVLQQKSTAPVPEPAPNPKPVTSTSTKEPVPVDKKPQPEPPKKELVMDMSAGSDTNSKAITDDTARKTHEEAENKRKAEWEAKQLAKKQAETEVIQRLNDMSDDDVIAASTKRISTDVERITRRNMKECVAAHIQELARKDAAFARKTMHPRKNMINCFKYINHRAKEFVEQEMKDNDIKPDNGIYGTDVPDGLCYQWAEDYFNTMDVAEDGEKEEKFVPKPYTGTVSSKTSDKPKKTTSKAKKTEKPATNEAKKNQESKNNYQQMSLF